jgi:poly(A) polymerase
MRELGQWWAHAQQLPHETLAAALPNHGGAAVDAEITKAPPRRRRRRRKPTGK